MPIVDNLNGDRVPKVISQSPQAPIQNNASALPEENPGWKPRSIVRTQKTSTNNKVMQSNGVADYSSAPKPQSTVNQYNDLVAQQAAARKQAEQSKAQSPTGLGLLDEFNLYSNLSIPINEKYDAQFLEDPDYQHLAQSSMNKRLAVRSIARQSLNASLKANSIQVQEQTEAQLRQRKLNAMLLSGGGGAITNEGLRFGLKSEGVKFIDALRMNNRVTIDELSKLHATNILEADDEADKMLSQYIEIEKGKKKAEAVALMESGRIAQIDDKSLLSIAREAGIPEITMLTMKASVLDQQNPQSAKIVENEISKIRGQYSPSGFKINGTMLIGGRVDENGIYRFEQPKSTDRTANGNPMQWCAGFVNSAIGTNIGSLYTDKEKKITSKVPLQYGFFIEKNGIIDKESGLEYGHTGLIEAVSDDGNTIQIAESNYDNRNGFRRVTLTKRADGKWASADGKVVKNITGFGQGKIVAEKQVEIESQDPVVQKNYDVVQEWSNTKAPSQLPQFDLGITSNVKSRLGLSDDEIIGLANSAKLSGGYANAVAINFFNQNKLQLPQALLDAAPRDKLEMVKTMANLYKTDVPASTFKNIINAGILDDEMSAQLAPFASDYANATIAREEADAQKVQNDYNLKVQQNNIDLEKVRSSETIAANKLLFDQQEQQRKDAEKVPKTFNLYAENNRNTLSEDDVNSVKELQKAYNDILNAQSNEHVNKVLQEINSTYGTSFKSKEDISKYTDSLLWDDNGNLIADANDVTLAKEFLDKGGDPKTIPTSILEKVVEDTRYNTPEIKNAIDNKQTQTIQIISNAQPSKATQKALDAND